MEATVPQIQKRLYRNNTGGYLGVVIIDHKGEEKGTNVEPYGSIWLSDSEAVLTARAPARPEDNPFEEQVFYASDEETGQKREVRMRPLTLERDDARYVPAQDRFVPIYTDDQEGLAHADAAAHAEDPAVVMREDRREQVVAAHRTDVAPPVATASAVTPMPTVTPVSSARSSAAPEPPPPTPAAPSSPTPRPRTGLTPPPPPSSGLRGTPGPESGGSEAGESWVATPEAPGRVLTGALAGSDEPAPRSGSPDATPTVPSPGMVPPQATPPMPAMRTAEEEHAAAVDPQVGEETGQAERPVSPPPQGEYARAEEVGSPEAPAAQQPPPEDDEPLVGG